jgi:hypothetical protein
MTQRERLWPRRVAGAFTRPRARASCEREREDDDQSECSMNRRHARTLQEVRLQYKTIARTLNPRSNRRVRAEHRTVTQIVIGVPSNFVNLKPSNGSTNVRRRHAS